MNHREQTHLRVCVRRALHALSLLLLPTVAPKNFSALTNSRAIPGRPGKSDADSSPLPYLSVLGAPALRFQEAPPPPDLSTRPAAAAPPVPALTLTETTVAQANLAAAHTSTPPPPVPAPAAESPAENAKPAPAPATSDPALAASKRSADGPAPTAPAKTAQPILPDESHPSVRPEDFLPYFQIPGAGGQPGVNVIMPAVPTASGSLPVPPSSATYTQSPK